MLQYPVVRQDLHLVVRKNNRQEKTASAPSLPGSINPRRCRAAMMTVGDVQIGNFGESGFEVANVFGLVDDPGGVADSVAGGEIDGGSFLCLGLDHPIHGRLGGVG